MLTSSYIYTTLGMDLDHIPPFLAFLETVAIVEEGI
jgi:hypothetical protein